MEGNSSQDLSRDVFIPLLISASGIVATTIAVLVYHFIVVRFCLTRARFRGVIDGSLPIIQSEKAGLDRKILDAIPVLFYSTEPGQVLFRVDQTECAVCLGELEEKVLVRLLPNCRHVFHVQCIDKWLSFHSNCPVCRSPIQPMEVAHVSLSVRDEESGGSERRRFGLPLISPLEREKPRRLVTGLRRSLSVDNSHVVRTILERENNDDDDNNNNNNNNDIDTDKNKTSSSMLIRSFSQLQPGQSNSSSSAKFCCTGLEII